MSEASSILDAAQNFLAVYDKLRDVLVEDKALGNQPPQSKDWLKQASFCGCACARTARVCRMHA